MNLATLKEFLVTRVLNPLGLYTKHQYLSLKKHYLNKQRSQKRDFNELSRNYNDLLSTLIKKDSREKLQKWSRRLREKQPYCDICSSTKNLTVHHLWDKKTHPTLAFQDENGVVLCKKCHDAFHKKYKTGAQVTPAMYQKFKNECIGWMNVLKEKQ